MTSQAYEDYMREMRSISQGPAKTNPGHNYRGDAERFVQDMKKSHGQSVDRDYQDDDDEELNNIENADYDFIDRVEAYNSKASNSKGSVLYDRNKSQGRGSRSGGYGKDDEHDNSGFQTQAFGGADPNEDGDAEEESGPADPSAAPFAPRISLKSRQIWQDNPKAPLHQRFQDELQLREERLRETKIRVARERELKAQKEQLVPPVPIKKDLTKGLGRDKDTPKKRDIYSDGLRWIKERRTKLLEQQSKQLDQEIKASDFSPSINRNNAYYSQVSKSFEKRQKEYEQERMVRKHQLESDVYGRYRFKPSMSEKSQAIAQRKKVKTQIQEKTRTLQDMYGANPEQDQDDDFDETLIFKSYTQRKSVEKSIRPASTVNEFSVSDSKYMSNHKKGTSKGNDHMEFDLPLKPATNSGGRHTLAQKKIHSLKTHDDQFMIHGASHSPAKSSKQIPRSPRIIEVVNSHQNMQQPSSSKKSIGVPMRAETSRGKIAKPAPSHGRNVSSNRLASPSPKAEQRGTFRHGLSGSKTSKSPTKNTKWPKYF
jgi:hypothetical protein